MTNHYEIYIYMANGKDVDDTIHNNITDKEIREYLNDNHNGWIMWVNL